MTSRPAPLQRRALRIFSGLAGSYDAVLDSCTLLQDRRWKAWVVKCADVSGRSTVLDLGCGTCVLEERLPRGCHVVGLDLSREMLSIGLSKHAAGVGSLLLSDAQRLPFRAACFDAVLSCYVVKYCDTRALVSQMARVLKPDGRLVLYDFVRPRGALWPLNAMYTYGGLRAVGKLLDAGHARSAYTFQALPGIIRTTPWEVGFGEALKDFGFFGVEERLLSGGVALGISATRAADDPQGRARAGGQQS